MSSQLQMIGMNCDWIDAMIKTKTLRYNHKKARNFKNEFRAFLWLFLKYYSKNEGRNNTLFQQVHPTT